MDKGETHWSGLCQRDVDYCWAMLLQLGFIVLSIPHVKERVSGPLQKARLGWGVICTMVIAAGWRDAAGGWVLL
jgi:hypothetical protein